MDNAYEAIIGLEVHAELATQSKMFCACPVVDTSQAEPNTAVCPVCSAMPGTLPVLNRQAVDYGLRVALALGCEIAPRSVFARKNYFYPDLPKGYQISQYEQPLARHGRLTILTPQGERLIRIRRVHLEEDTGKLTHIPASPGGEAAYTLVDLNRAGVPLLEIVTEPDFRTAEEVRLYAQTLRAILRYLGVNSGDLQKGVMRIEPNVSVRPRGSSSLGTKVEIKNLNSFRALERGVAYEIQRQTELLQRGERVRQETVGWDEARQATFTQRVKEGEEDYRYFPEPDLPPLLVDAAWLDAVRAALPELPAAKARRFQQQYGLNAYDASLLTAEREVADYFEQAVTTASDVPSKTLANWMTGELFSLLNRSGLSLPECPISPPALAALVRLVSRGEISQSVGKTVLAEMFSSGQSAEAIVAARGLRQVSDAASIAVLVQQVLEANPAQVEAYLAGRSQVAQWLFGQVMRAASGQANPQVVKAELSQQLEQRKATT